MKDRSRLLLIPCVAIAVVFAGTTIADEAKPVVIKPEDARQHAGKRVRVTFKVQASKHAKHRKTVFLDSEKDFRDERNLGIALSEKAVEELKRKRNIDAPAEHFLGKVIRVTGKVVIREERPYIDVDQADQLEAVKQASKE